MISPRPVIWAVRFSRKSRSGFVSENDFSIRQIEYTQINTENDKGSEL